MLSKYLFNRIINKLQARWQWAMQWYDGISWIICCPKDQAMEMLTLGTRAWTLFRIITLPWQSPSQRNSCSLMTVQPSSSSSLCHYSAGSLDMALNLYGPIPALTCSHCITQKSQRLLFICVKQEHLSRRKWSKHLLLKLLLRRKSVLFSAVKSIPYLEGS